MKPPKAKINIGGNQRQRYMYGLDTRQGLGYGLTVPSGRFNNRQMQSSYPYADPDEWDLDDEPDDSATDEFITKVLGNYTGHDSGLSADPFYVVAGNTKLSEIAVSSNSISAIPGAYKEKQASAGGYTTSPQSYRVGSMKRTGSKMGYFSPPPESRVAAQDRHDVIIQNLRDFLTNDELAVLRAKLQVLNANGGI